MTRRLLALLLLAGLAGCNGKIVRTHAKPPGLRYFHPLSHKACRLQVAPCESTSPARSQVVLIASVTDAEGNPLRGRRVEWMLEGAGQIVEVDESGYLHSRGYKVDNRYAVSHTDWFEHTIHRTAHEADDFIVKPGQSWCVITSAVEGDTYVTAYAPDVEDWNANRLVVTHHWIDAGFTLPAAVTARSGEAAPLTTNLFRHSDRAPLAGYRVRYRVLDGAPAVLLPGHGPEAVVTTDLSGNATVGVVQPEPRLGRTRVAVEVLRAPDPSLPSGAALSIGRGETAVDWQAPAVSVVPSAPTGAPGQDVTLTLTVRNSGPVESRALTVRAAVPEGARYVRSDPPASVEGNTLVWTLAGLAGNSSRTLTAVFRPAAAATLTSRVRVDTGEGLRDEKDATIRVEPPAAPQLRIAQTGPAQAVVVPGVAPPAANGLPATFLIAVSNPGTAPATTVRLQADFDAELGHDTGAARIELPVGTLAPGETRTVPLTLRPVKPGVAAVRVAASADGGLADKSESKVEVREARLTVALKGGGARLVGKPVVFDVEVANAGQVPLGDVTVSDVLPPELGYAASVPPAMPGGGREVVWRLGTLEPGQKRQLQLTATAGQAAGQAVNVVQAAGYPVLAGEPRPAHLPQPLTARAESAVFLQGAAALRMSLTDTDDPLEVGGRTNYRIEVTNPGSLPAGKVALAAVLPPQMRLVAARGPAPYQVEGNRVVFAPLDAVGVGQAARYEIEAEAVAAGDARFRAELTGGPLREPLVKEESTNVR